MKFRFTWPTFNGIIYHGICHGNIHSCNDDDDGNLNYFVEAEAVPITSFESERSGVETPSGMVSVPTGMETPDQIQLKKDRGGASKNLYTVIPQKEVKKGCNSKFENLIGVLRFRRRFPDSWGRNMGMTLVD